MMGAYMTYPLSKGSLHITSKSDPFAAPDFDAGFFSDPSDISANRWMFKK
jgi:alcohol oxidase